MSTSRTRPKCSTGSASQAVDGSGGTLPTTIAGALTERERYLLNCIAKAGNELISDVVPCWCGASEGEYCIGRYGQRTSSPHADRRDAAQCWRKAHPKAWIRMKDETFRRIVKGLRP